MSGRLPLITMELEWQGEKAMVVNPTHPRGGPPIVVDREKMRAWVRQLVEAAQTPAPPSPYVPCYDCTATAGLNWECDKPYARRGRFLAFYSGFWDKGAPALLLQEAGIAIAKQAVAEANPTFIAEVEQEFARNVSAVEQALVPSVARMSPELGSSSVMYFWSYGAFKFKKHMTEVPRRAPVRYEKDRGLIAIPEPVHFATNKNLILSQSFQVLKDVADLLRAEEDIKKVDVQYHTDRPLKAFASQDLAERRAQSVMQWLIDRGGIDPARLTAHGHRPPRPTTPEVGHDNTTDRGIELHVVDPPSPDRP
jgi:outer membrane protein OmpA-like peptidoglycan-associated protein